MFSMKSVAYKAFIACFCALLLYPNTGLFRGAENAKIVAKENRKITAFPKASPVSKSFYINLEKWYQDRLRYRDIVIKFWRELNFSGGVILSDTIFLGKDGWLFNRGNVIKELKYREEKVQFLKRLQDFCHRQGAEFVFLPAPPKEAIYADLFPARERRKYKPYADFEKELFASLRRRGVNSLALAQELRLVRKKYTEPIYFKDDHHWSYFGSATASDLLLEKFASLAQKPRSQLFKKIPLDKSKDGVYKECSQSNALGFGQTRKTVAPWSSRFTEQIYVKDGNSGKEEKLKVIPSNNVLWGRIVKGEGIIINKALPNHKTLLILGDSYSSYMVPYLSQYFRTVVSTHHSNNQNKKKADMAYLLKKYKPDYVLLQMLGNSFYASKNKNSIGRISLPE